MAKNIIQNSFRKAILLSSLSLFACQQPSQNSINAADLGKASLVVFGTVLSEHSVTINHETTGAGATAGGLAGGLGGSYIGHGGGSLFGLIGGALVGAVAGHIAEEQISHTPGIEYVIKTYNPGKEFRPIITIAQNIAKDDKPIHKGDCVMVQTQGSYQRILPEDDKTLCGIKDDSDD